MARLRVRWANDPNELPGPGEALARLQYTSQRRETFPDGTSGIVRGGYRISIETHDGRRLVADVPQSDSERAAPLVESDADAELVHALNRVWRAAAPIGRPPEVEQRIAAIIAAVRAGARTRRAAAQALGQLTEWGELRGSFKRDVADERTSRRRQATGPRDSVRHHVLVGPGRAATTTLRQRTKGLWPFRLRGLRFGTLTACPRRRWGRENDS
jgi:hypothetical protein